MKKIKIFLASSEDLTTETLELADLVEHLNLILEKQDIHIYLCKWEYLQSKEDYDDTLDSSDLSLVIFGRDFGSYSEEDLKKVYERVCKEGANPQKLYVYFKAGEDQTEALKKFRDSFPDQFGHFTGNFADINALRADFMLQFQLFQNQNNDNDYCEVKVKDGKVYLNEKEVFIDMMKVPFMGNNKKYTDLINDIVNLKTTLQYLPKDLPVYAQQAALLKEKEKEKEKVESSLWDTALNITRLSNQKCSERLQRAIDLFNQGDNKGANAILNEEEIYRDAEKNLNLIKLGEEGKKGLITNIEELKLKVKTLENEMTKGWLEQIIEINKKIVDYTEQVYGKDSREYVSSLHSIGNYLRTAAKYKEALAFEKKAIAIAESVFGENHPHTAIAYNNVGSTYGDLGEYNKALEYKLKALKISENVLGENHPDTASAYNNVGLSYGELEEYDKALKYQLKALKISENKLGEDHPGTALSYNNVGGIYGELGLSDKALEYKLKALKIWENIFGKNHPYTASSYNNAGFTYRELEEYDKALEYQLKALKIREDIFGENHPHTANSYFNVGLTYEELGEYDKALEYQLKALKIRENKLGENHPDTAIAYNNIGVTFRNLKDYNNAIKYKTKSVIVYKTLLGENHPNLSIIISGLGLVYLEIAEYEKALEQFMQAFEISKKNQDKRSMGVRLNRIGKTYALMGDKETAKAKFEEALKLLPEDHPEAEDTRKRLDELKNIN